MTKYKLEIDIEASDIVRAQVIVKDALNAWIKANNAYSVNRFKITKAREMNPTEKRI